jgi:excisionase family DNA binding protein
MKMVRWRGTAIAHVMWAFLIFQEKERVINLVENEHEILTMKELCYILHVHQATIYKMVKQGKIPSFRIGSEWRFRRDAIERWIAGKTEAVEMSEVGDPLSQSEHRTFEHKPSARH